MTTEERKMYEPDDDAAILDLIDIEGKTAREVGELLGRTRAGIRSRYLRLKRAGVRHIPSNRGRAPENDPENEWLLELTRLHAEGLNDADLSRRLKCARRTVRRYRERLGLEQNGTRGGARMSKEELERRRAQRVADRALQHTKPTPVRRRKANRNRGDFSDELLSVRNTNDHRTEEAKRKAFSLPFPSTWQPGDPTL